MGPGVRGYLQCVGSGGTLDGRRLLSSEWVPILGRGDPVGRNLLVS